MHTPGNEATRHLTLIEKVRLRRDELKLALAEDGPDRADIESALATLGPMFTGDLENPPDMVSRNLVRWLDANKYVGAKTAVWAAEPAAPAATPEVEPAGPTVTPEVGPDPDHSVETFDADNAMAEPTGAVPIRP